MQLWIGPIHESVAVCNTRYPSGPSPKEVHQDARKFVENNQETARKFIKQKGKRQTTTRIPQKMPEEYPTSL